jgi:hypothetical protein
LNKETGEIEEYERDVVLDGYYVLVSSELEMINVEIIEKYKSFLK